MTEQQAINLNPLTIADLDEWTADVEKSKAANLSATHVPHEWARTALGALLGEDIPHQVWTCTELLATLRRARQVLAEASQHHDPTYGWRTDERA